MSILNGPLCTDDESRVIDLTQRSAILVGLFGITMLLLLVILILFHSQPTQFHSTLSDSTTISFAADSQWMFPDSCIQATWEIQGIKAANLYGQANRAVPGIVGVDQKEICIGSANLVLEITLPDDSTWTHTLSWNILHRGDLWVLFILGIAGITCSLAFIISYRTTMFLFREIFVVGVLLIFSGYALSLILQQEVLVYILLSASIFVLGIVIYVTLSSLQRTTMLLFLLVLSVFLSGVKSALTQPNIRTTDHSFAAMQPVYGAVCDLFKDAKIVWFVDDFAEGYGVVDSFLSGQNTERVLCVGDSEHLSRTLAPSPEVMREIMPPVETGIYSGYYGFFPTLNTSSVSQVFFAFPVPEIVLPSGNTSSTSSVSLVFIPVEAVPANTICESHGIEIRRTFSDIILIYSDNQFVTYINSVWLASNSGYLPADRGIWEYDQFVMDDSLGVYVTHLPEGSYRFEIQSENAEQPRTDCIVELD